MAGHSMGAQTQSPGISRPGRILCWKSMHCLDTLLRNFNMVLFSTFLWAVKLFPPFALDVAPFQGDMWFLHEFIAHKRKLQQMARSSPRWCALVGHVAFFLCCYVSNPEQQKDICFFQLSSELLLEEDRAYEVGLFSQAPDLLVQIFPLLAVTHCTSLKVSYFFSPYFLMNFLYFLVLTTCIHWQ